MRTLRIALVSLLILVVTGSVQSATIRVPEDYPTIQAGIDAAENDDVVLVADGTYVESLNFLGKAITVESVSGNPALCIIYGNKRDPVVTFGSGEGAGSVLRGFRIQDGGGDEGGGILCSKSSPTIANNIITKNGAYYYGGGIRCTDNSSPIIINNVISRNNARYGGGIHCTGNSSPIICHNTIMGNRADETGSGIYCYTSSATIVNTILWNYALSEIHQSRSSIEVTYSVVRGGYPGIGNINEYPRFVSANDYHLSDHSPCIGAGMMTQDVPDTDIEGNPRPYPGGSAPDMGAYENSLSHPLPHSTTTIHVSTTGSDDTGDGSSVNPYLTIQRGINEAFDDDIVVVADGTYIENLDFHGKAITVESASGNPEYCIIDGSGKDHVVIFSTYEEADSVLRGFTIQNGVQGAYCRYSSPTIARNIVTDTSGSGINCYSSSPIITNNLITKNESEYHGGGGIYCWNSSPAIAGNMITGNSSDGIYCSSDSSAAIISNTITGNASHHYGGGIYCSSDSSVVVINTILWGNMPQEIYPGVGDVDVTCSNVRGGYPGVGNIDAYPNFAGVSDYHLSDYSPCIGAGIMTQDMPDTDIEGNLRPYPAGSNPDMGAYENRLEQPLPYSPVTIHVSTTGSDDTGDGSPDNPYLTIQRGIDVALDGDNVLVADGTYMENLSFLGKAITVESVSSNPEYCIIDGDGKDHVVTFNTSEDPDSVLRGFTIQNGMADYPGGGIYCLDSSPTIASNMIKGNPGTGVCCVHNSSPIIISNTIMGNKPSHSGGGIQCTDNSSPTIINNVIAGNNARYGGGISCSDSSFPIIYNSTITGNNGSGIYCPSDSFIAVINTILWDNMPQEIYPGNGSVEATYSNIRGGYPGAGNINEYPRFADIDDYHLSDYSPCIGAGIMTQDVPDTDIEGNPRPYPGGSAPDIGAYESNRGVPLPPPARRTIHISTTGSDDTGDGSSGNPYLTIQKGIDEAFDGDTVLVADGTYIEDLTFHGKAITVESASGNPELCIIDGNSLGNVVTFDSGEDTDSVLRGFTIQNGKQGTYCLNSSPTIASNRVTGNSGAGISCYNSSPTISNNVVMGNEAGWPGGAGIYCTESSSPIIVSNIIVGNKANHTNGGGICCTGNSSSIIISNVIAGNEAEYGGGIYCSDGSSPIISNNTISGNRADDTGGGLFCPTPSTVVINTILWDNMPQEISPGDGSISVTYSNVRGGYPGVGNINEYPRFAGIDDYHLSDYSPCIGAGNITQDMPNTDIEGNPRPNPSGSAPDIGAYENRLGQPLPHSPTTIHVSTTGSDDTGDGSPDNPYLTIQKGIDEAFDGGIVLVADGTYMENLSLHGKAITVESASGNPEHCIIDGNSEGSVVTFDSGEDTDSVLRGFTIQNGKADYGGGAIFCWNSSPTIDSNVISGNSGNGISCSNCSPIITSNIVAGNSADGIYCSDSSSIITSNTISGNSSSGIYCSDSSIITNNIITKNTIGIFCSDSPTITSNIITGNSTTGISCYNSSAVIISNVVTGNKKTGIPCSHNSFVTLISNTITGNNSGGVSCSSDSSITMVNTILWGNMPQEIYPFDGSADITYSNVRGGYPGIGNIDEYPHFAGANDYHLSDYSPCIGAGIMTQDVPGTDIEGNPRPNPVGSNPDMGAYENVLGQPLPRFPATIHVSTTGSDDTGDGSSDNPYLTIQRGIDAALDGDTVLVADGTYMENLVFPGKDITVESASGNPEYCIIDGGGEVHVVTFDSGESADSILRGFTIQNGRQAIYCSNSSPTITSNIITGNLFIGIYCSYSSPVIDGNMIKGNPGGAIECFYSSPTITSNVVADNSGGISCSYSYPVIISNTIVGNGSGISCSSHSISYIPVINTILWNYVTQEIYPDGCSFDVTYSNVRGGYPGAGNIDVYPRFAGVDDYHLSDYSPCIGAGMMTQDVPDTDIEGNPRPNPAGSNPDIGAYENSLSQPLPHSITTIHVSTTGSDDTGDGSSDNPYLTIQKGINEAFDDDTVLVANGTYMENLSFHGKAITVESASGNPEHCIIDGAGRDHVVTFNTGEDTDSALRVFTIQSGKEGIYCLGSSPTIASNSITGNSGNGISCSDSSPIITSNSITGNSGSGISCSDSSPIITSNSITGNSGDGISCSDSSVTIANNMIIGNLVTGISCTSNSSATVINNTIVDNKASWCGGISCSSNTTIINTILWNVASREISSNAEVTYSNVQGGYPGVGNINEYPRFAGTNDYNLSDYSPCIGAGIMTQDVPDTDLEGNPRPNPAGSNPDIGACESNRGAPLPPPARRTIHISITGSDDTGDGSPDNPYFTIQRGIVEAFDGDTVLVADGTYIENLDFLGKAITVESASRDPDSCIIDGDRKDNVVTFNTGEDLDSSLRGFTIRNGKQGIYCLDSSPTITSNIITGNKRGDGISCSDSSPTIVNNIITGNDRSNGISCSDSSPTIVNNIITGNSGNGISCSYNSFATLINNTIAWNNSGGISCSSDSTIVVFNTILWGNMPQEIYPGDGNVSVTYSVVRGGYPGVGNIDVYPRFAGVDDYHLSDYSPCIGAGTMTQDVPGTDIEGNPRPNPAGSAPDMGAYENSLSQPLPRSPAIIHVSTTGSDDTGDGSMDKPYLTIQRGIDEAFDGDRVLVADGTYMENLDFLGKAITVESASGNPEYCIIDGDRKDNVVTFSTGEDSDSVLRGFTIQNGRPDYRGGGIYCLDSSPTIVSNMITSNFGAGISCYNCFPIISNNIIMENEAGWPGGGGIYCGGSTSPIITNNIIVGNKANHGNGGGICCTGNSSSIIINNVISGNEAEYGGGIYCSDGSSPIISNNTISGNRADDIGGGLFCPTPSTVVINSIFWDNMPQDIYPGDGSVDVTYSNVRGGYPGVGNIDAYPRFAGVDDYHLSDYSLCIGAGTMTQDVPDTDIEGNSRPYPGGSAPDIGAYESRLSVPLPPRPTSIIIHISTTGSDGTGDGSSDNPYLTIQRGIIEAFDGDTVLVADGTYIENLNFQSKAITVEPVSSNPELCIIDGDGKDSVVTFRNSERADSVLRGFTIQNGERGIYCWNSSPTVASNIIAGNSSIGIHCDNSSTTIASNTITGNSGDGIYCIDNSSTTTIVNNMVTGNSGTAISCLYDSSATVINNTIVGNDKGGIYYYSDSSITVINSIFWDNMPQDIYPGDGSVNVTYSNVRGGYPGAGNIDAYPRFAGANDYHLSDYSPCVGAGMMTQDMPNTDIEGNPRPNPAGSAPDIGAYESRLSVPLPPRPTPIIIHISTTGSDGTGDGSSDNPYLTIQRGIIEAFDGDTVLVADGTYMENLSFYGKAITVQPVNSNPEVCIIDGDGKDSVVTFRNSERADSVLRGFTIQNGERGIYCWNSSPTVASNIITANSSIGIHCDNSSTTITSNMVAGNSSIGVYCHNSSTIIASNTITGNLGTGIHCSDSSPIITSNSIIGNSDTGIHCFRSSPIIANNIITGNSGTAISCLGDSSATVISNTIVGNSDSYTGAGGIYCYRASATAINTILWGNMPQEVRSSAGGVNITYSVVRGGYPGVGNIDAYPNFAGVSDYHLSDYSPCIGAGIMTQDVPDTDIEGNPRPNPSGSAPDIGAYENRLSETASITIISPNGGEAWRGGSSHEIIWQTSGSNTHCVRLLYSTDSGDTYPNTIVSSTPNNGKYKWDPVPTLDSAQIRVKAILEDSSSNVLATDATDADFIIDSTGPDTSIALSGTEGGNGWYISDVVITLSAEDSLAGVRVTKYKVGDGTWVIYSSPFTVTGSPIRYYSEDNAGNVEAEKSMEVRIDKVAPETTATLSGAEGKNGWYTSDVTVTLSATDDGSGINETRYRIDDGIWKTYSLPLTLTGSTVHYYSEDNAGNTEAEKSIEVKIDKVAPETTATLSGAEGKNGWYTSDVTVTLSATDDGSGINETRYRIDDGIWKTYSLPLTLTGSTVHYYSEDNAGHAEAEKTIEVKIDKVAPETTATLSGTEGENGWYISDVTVTLSATDSLSGVKETKYKMSSGSWETYSKPFIVPASTNGTIVYYLSEDNAGNIEAVESQQMKIDKTAPSTPVVTDDGDHLPSTNQLHASWTSSDAQSGVSEYQYAIGTTPGGVDVINWTSTGTGTEVTVTGLSLTSGRLYYFAVKARNGAGLWSDAGASDGIAKRAELLTASCDLQNPMLTLTFTDLIDPGSARFDGIGMEVNDSGQWDLVLSDHLGLKVSETAPSKEINIDMKRAHIVASSLARAFMNHRKVDILLKPVAFTDTFGLNIQEVVGTDDIEIQMISDGFMLGMVGDVNGNGEVTVDDAELILRSTIHGPTVFPIYSVASNVSNQLAAYGYSYDVMMGVADADGSGDISSYDSAMVFRWSAGLGNLAPAFSSNLRKCRLSVSDYDERRLEVSIDVDDVSDVYSADIVMTYDPQRLLLSDASRTSSISGWLFEHGMESTASRSITSLRISLAGACQPSSNGPLITLSFDVLSADAVRELDIAELRLNGGMIKTSIENLPRAFALLQNYPNPFNPETWIPYQLTEVADVTITIYSVNGQIVRQLELGSEMPGHYVDRQRAAYWDSRNEWGENVSSGVYFYVIQAGTHTDVRKMLMLK